MEQPQIENSPGDGGQQGGWEVAFGVVENSSDASSSHVFSQDVHHEDEIVPNEDDSTYEAKRAEMTKTFFQAFFDYPTINAQDYQVPVEEIDFLYENIVPLRFRQRKQERAKYRLNELREALQRSSDEAAGILPPPPGEGQDHASQHHEKARKRRKIDFDKKAWIKRERTRSYWLGMRGPYFPAHLDAFQKLEKLVGHPFPNLTESAFRTTWESEMTKRQHTATFLLSNPKPSLAHAGFKQAGAGPSSSSSFASIKSPPPFPVYDMWRDADQPSNPNAPHSLVHFAFDVPGVEEEPKFTLSKATRKWQLEGTRTTPGMNYITQLRAAGRFVARGMVPNSVDVSVEPKTSFGNGIFHVSLAEHVE